MPRPPDPPRLQLRDEPGQPKLWYIHWTENGRRRRRSTGRADRRGADRVLQAFRAEIRPELANRGLDEISLGDLLDRYGQAAIGRVAAPERIGYAIARLAPFWAERAVADVDEAAVRAYWRARLADGVGDGTIRRELVVLAAALAQAAREKLIPAPPPVWQPPRPAGRADWLTRDQLAALIRAARRQPQARAHLPAFILIGFYTGSRKRAILDLRWEKSAAGGHVDLAAGRIDFNPAGRTPTKKRRAVVPIPPGLRTTLQALARRGTETVVANRRGRPVQDVKRAFQTAAEAAGVAWATPHTLRHSCITHLLLADVPRYDVSKYCAISMAELERTYGHHAPDYLEHVAASWRAARPRPAQARRQVSK